jgi:hypothetical protein
MLHDDDDDDDGDDKLVVRRYHDVQSREIYFFLSLHTNHIINLQTLMSLLSLSQHHNVTQLNKPHTWLLYYVLHSLLRAGIAQLV